MYICTSIYHVLFHVKICICACILHVYQTVVNTGYTETFITLTFKSFKLNLILWRKRLLERASLDIQVHCRFVCTCVVFVTHFYIYTCLYMYVYMYLQHWIILNVQLCFIFTVVLNWYKEALGGCPYCVHSDFCVF